MPTEGPNMLPRGGPESSHAAQNGHVSGGTSFHFIYLLSEPQGVTGRSGIYTGIKSNNSI